MSESDDHAEFRPKYKSEGSYRNDENLVSPTVRQDSTDGFEIQSIDKFYMPKVVVGTEIPLITLEEMKKLDPQCVDIKKILILYTGGTIGMRMKNGAFEPEPNYMTKALRKLPMFNDSRIRKEAKLRSFDDDIITVENSEITSYLSIGLSAMSDAFIMPKSPENVRVIFNVWEYSPLLDSSDMTMDDYLRISKDIEKEYDQYDGFIILHGTDTMSFTGSALSFLLENLTKPVILTGSQIPLFQLRSDGRDNLLDSLLIASHYNVPEVTIYFHQKLYRANRSTKQSSVHFDAFDSPNYPPLAELGINVHVYEHRLLSTTQKTVGKNLAPILSKLCPNVTVLRVFPSITCDTVRAILAPPVEGVVLQTYGSGNMPYCRRDLLQCFKEATERGVIIINITQCWRGGVKAIYRTGFVLKEYGILPGLDMTLEAALTKLSYVLSVDKWSLETKRSAMTRSLRGEMTTVNFSSSHTKRTLSQDGIFIEQDVIIAAALCASAKDGNVAQLDQLGKRRGDWEAVDYDGRTALHIGVTNGQMEVIKFLLEREVHVNKRDIHGYTPLRCAILSRASLQMLTLLKDHGAELGLTKRETFDAVKDAILKNDIEMLKCYYAAGVDVKMVDDSGNSFLHLASMFGRSEIIKWFVTTKEFKGNEIQSNNNTGNTAADEAYIRDFHKIYHYLSSGANSIDEPED